jgi:type II secretory pathway component GspD/PulD (secretin)/tetratricopeptide (TPR) repeat protein
MAFQANRSALVLMGATLLTAPGLTAAAAITEAAGRAEPVASAQATSLQSATQLLEQGRLIEAQNAARQLVMGGTLTDADRAEAANLLARIERRVRTADPIDLSLQKARLAVAEGDLALAERHASAVLARSGSSPAALSEARAVQSTIASRREELRPLIEGVLAAGVQDFAAGRFAEAKSAFAAVQRTGVELSPDQQQTLSSYQMKVVEIERRQGQLLPESAVGLAMMQPGTVRRPAKPPQPAPETTPVAATTVAAAQPATETFPPVAAAEPAPAPAPAAAVASEPAPTSAPAPMAVTAQATAAPAPAPAGDDLITLAMRIEAERLLAEADLALSESRFGEAVEKYQTALNAGRPYLTQAQIEKAERSLAEAQIRLRGSGGGLAEQVVTNVAIIRERAIAEFENELEQSDRALKTGDAPLARTASSRAQLAIGNARQYFSEAEVEGFNKRVSDLNRAIAEVEETSRSAEAVNRERELATRAQKAQQALAVEKQRRIEESISRVRALQAEQKYEEARQVVDQVLFLDPTNPTAQLLADVLDDIMVFRRADMIARRKSRNVQELMLQAREAAEPATSLMSYPADWPARTFRRGEGGMFAETAENRATLSALEKRIPADFRDNTLGEVVDYVRQLTNVNVDVDWESLRSIGVDPETTVTLTLDNLPASVVLGRALARVGRDQFTRAGFTVMDGIVTIGSQESLRRQTVTQPYNITDLLLEIPNYTDAPDIDLVKAYRQMRDAAYERPFDRRAEQANGESREERIRKLVGVLQKTIDPSSWRDNGGDVGAIQELNGSLIITTTPQNHREIVGLLSRLREIRSLQVNVESRFLAIRSDFFEQIGFDIDIYFNVNNNQVENARANDPTIRPGDFFNFNQPFYLNRNVTGNQAPTVPTAPPTTQGTIPPDRWSPIGGGQNSLGLTQSLAGGFSPFAQDVLSQAPALGVAGQFLDDIQVDFLIKATQADRRSTTLTAPRLTLTNGQISFVAVTTQRSFVGDLTPIVGESAVGFDPQPNVIAEGVTLSVEPVVSADRRYVTINVNTSVNQTERPFRQVQVTAVAGGQLVQSGQVGSFIELPTVNVTQVQTTVTVPDEGTILLGGQRLVTELEVETGVPVLSKIPILNRFFTNRLQSKEEQTLLILLKPTIIIQTEEEERNFPGLLDSVRTGLGN